MSAPTMNGTEVAKSASPATAAAAAPAATAGPRQHLKNSNSAKMLEGTRKQAASPVDNQIRKQQPQKAWQGPNPITQRASVSVTNGIDKPLPKLPTQLQQNKSTADTQVDKQAHDRTLYLLAQFIGKDASINLKNGEQFSGVFSGGSCEISKSQYVLKMAKRTRLPSQQQTNGSPEASDEYIGEGEDHTMTFDVQDTISLCVQDVVFASASKHLNGSAGSSFLTDTQISHRERDTPRQRELQPWVPGPDSITDVSLEDTRDSGWDQFAANERLYGVQSTYDETIYTTAIDRSNPRFRQRQAEADRIAREIEGSAPANAHVAEERRKDTMRDDGLDEEEKYSGVKREAVPLPKRAAGAYIPPSQRPITGNPTVPGAPFDPAIISTKISQPASAVSANVEHVTSLPTTAQAASLSEQTKPASQADASQGAQTGLNAAQLAKKPKENTTEDHVRGTADAFKQFANNEKLRIRQAQEAKRSNLRQEKNVKLNDLKKFAANFKLTSRVPDDLVPILAKNREKQLEIQKKAEEAAKESESRTKDKDTEKPSSATSPAPSSTTSQAGAAGSVDSRLPYTQHRQRPSQSHIRPPVPPTQGQSPRAPQNPRMPQPFFGGRAPPPQPLPADLRIPPPNTGNDPQTSPSTSTRLNVNAKAFEFRPGASSFKPGASQSPRREPPKAFFDKDSVEESKPFSSAYDTFAKMAEADAGDENLKKMFTSNGGFPQAYRTQPTWPVTKENDSIKYLSYFHRPHAVSHGPSPVPTPGPTFGMPHNPQMHAPGPAQMMSTPSQRQHFYPPPQAGPAAPFDPRFPHFGGPNGSVQNSPRAQHLGPVFNNQLPGMPVPQYPGQPVQGYGMSPSMQYRQLQGPGTPAMMMPGQSPGQIPMRPGYPHVPQFQGPQMGGHMMAHNPSGGYVGGPMPNQGYSPMPPHAQPHMPHMQHGGPAGFSGSPRPPMMQQQGSHQGYQPQMHMQPGFAPSPGQHHAYHMQQRGMSAQFPQMTPRQQHAMPQHPSPGMTGVGAQGDEGK